MKRIACLLLLVLPFAAVAQKNKITNYCATYFLDPPDSSKTIFKEVAETDYMSEDSTLTDLRFAGKVFIKYNDKGQALFRMNIDSNSNVEDSIRWTYTASHAPLRVTHYSINDSSNKMEIKDDEIWKYDARGNEILDSDYYINVTLDYRHEKKRTYNTELKISAFHTWYDGDDNAIKTIKYTVTGTGKDDRDTATDSMRYDNHHNMTFDSYKSGFTLKRDYYKYNDKNLKTFWASVSYSDSNSTYYTYDTAGKISLEKKYKGNKLSYTDSIGKVKDGRYVETEEDIGDMDNLLSCPNNTVTVTTYDTGQRILMVVITKQKNGKPYVSTTTHQIILDHGHVLSDTATTIAKGYLYSLTSEKSTNRKFDANWNELEYKERGGGEYADNSKWSWLYNNKNKVTDVSQFNSCNEEHPMKEWKNEYHTDGVTVKVHTYIDEYGTTVWYYSDKARLTKKDIIRGKDRRSERIIEEYKD